MINLAQILGRVGKIETKTTSTGLKLTNLSIVTSKKVLKNGQKEEKVTWHNVTLFSKLAEIAEQYVNKGDLLYVQGEMEHQKYTGSDGVEKQRYFILGSEIKMMPKAKAHTSEPQKQAEKTNAEFGGFVDDDVPW